MSKHSGLSHLADVAREMISPAFAHYPVKRKGERRRLNPNWEGIQWLEGEDFLDATETVETSVSWDGLQVHTAKGWYAARRSGNCARPMFQVFGLESSSSATMAYTPCPDCDDWARTSQCRTHHDRDGVDRAAPGYGLNDRAHLARVNEALDRLINDTIEVNGGTLQGSVNFQFETPRWVDHGRF